MTQPDDGASVTRWRLVLGEAGEAGLGGPKLDGADAARDAALSWLYDREQELAARGVRGRAGRGPSAGGSGGSVLSVPDWIEDVHRLFPRETIERLERDAVERYRIDEVVTNPEVLKRVTPDQALLEAVLRTKHLMNPDVLALARALVAAVVRQLMEKLAREVRVAFAGVRDRRRRTLLKSARNFDAKGTVRANLDGWSPTEQRLYLRRPRFVARSRKHASPWQVILLVDQSGSMVANVIHSAVTAACLWGLPSLRTHLVAFDTNVVDLTSEVTDPVELLLKVQLGGGTDIAKAVDYGAQLIEAPRRAIVVLITDLFEGGSPELLVRRVRALCAEGTRVLVLAALDEQAAPVFDRDLGRALVNVGAQVGAMTPGELAAWIAGAVEA